MSRLFSYKARCVFYLLQMRANLFFLYPSCADCYLISFRAGLRYCFRFYAIPARGNREDTCQGELPKALQRLRAGASSSCGAQARRYTSPDEKPFTPRDQLPAPVLPPLAVTDSMRHLQVTLQNCCWCVGVVCFLLLLLLLLLLLRLLSALTGSMRHLQLQCFCCCVGVSACHLLLLMPLLLLLLLLFCHSR